MKFRWLAILAAMAVCAGAVGAQAKFLPESNNAALRYWAALVQMRDSTILDKATNEMLSAVWRGEAWDEAKDGPMVDAYAEAIQTMQRGTKLPECNWGMDFELGNQNLVEMFMRARGLERLNTVQGIRELANGDSKAAVETWIAGIRFGQDVGRGGPVIFAMVGSAILLDTLEGAAKHLGPGKLADADREKLHAAVKAMPEDGFDWGIAWGVEAAMGEEWLRKLQKADDPRAFYKRMNGMNTPVLKGVPPSEREVEQYVEFMLAEQGALREPPEKAKPVLEDLQARERKLSQLLQARFPNTVRWNEARAKVAAARAALLEALSAK